jgi:LysR family transcriptional regulator of gallate degradation
MNLDRLEHFVTVAQRGSIGQSAKVLSISQPALTRSIHKLERELNVKLFERGPRGMTLSTYGETFLPYAQAVLNEFQRATDELDAVRGQVKAQVRLGVSPNFLDYIVPEAVRRTMAAHPAVNIRLVTQTHEEFLSLLRARDLDVAFSQFVEARQDVLRPDEQADLRHEVLFDLESRVYGPAGHRLAGTGPIELAALAAERWAIPFQMSLSYRFENAFRRQGLASPFQQVNAASLPFLRRVVVEDGLLTVMPDHAAAAEVAAGRMVALDVPGLLFRYRVGLIYRRRVNHGPAAKTLMAQIRAVAKDAVPSRSGGSG